MQSRISMLTSILERRVWCRLKQAWNDLYVVSEYWKALTKRGEALLLISGLRKTRTVLRCHHALLSLPELYHPILVPGLTYLKAKRPCYDRLGLITEDMENPPAEINDIGCQVGFFSFSLPEKGYSINGYDMNGQNIRICDMINELKSFPAKPTFRNINLLPKTAEFFEETDYTLCLAVFHHIIYYHGLSVAQELVSVLRNKTRRKLYFEIGQSNEPVEPWAKRLPDMGSDPLVWIKDFLSHGGFKKIEVLDLVPTHVSNVLRYLVSAS